MRKAFRCTGVGTRRALTPAALALGLLLGGCVLPYNGYHYTPSYSSPPVETWRVIEVERRGYPGRKSHFGPYGWRGVSPSVHRGQPTGGHHRGGYNHDGRDRDGRGWRGR